MTTRPCGMSATSTAAARAVSTARQLAVLAGTGRMSTGTAATSTSRLMPRSTRATSCWSGVRSARNARAPAVSWLAKRPGAHAGRHVARLAVDAEAAREDLGAERLGDPVGLAREQRLVRLEGARRTPCRRAAAGRRGGPSAGRRGRPRRGRWSRSTPSRMTRRGGPGEDRQPVEAALGAHLLDQARPRC